MTIIWVFGGSVGGVGDGEHSLVSKGNSGLGWGGVGVLQLAS